MVLIEVWNWWILFWFFVSRVIVNGWIFFGIFFCNIFRVGLFLDVIRICFFVVR